ncbi:SagB family peptide dehydrogenase [Frankia sp. AgB32]|uniref:SagB/ThcOx family dehydrogenase n=1 Tax=Frankia sp. AgB32 TaxID=631119 RepID=UPI0020107105|nr:SagB family peptide dehydrogenase [Frankia sp. AgB32]MCK9897883.1 SagB family peptide dehydrogenase [Frankia sp. AgB32]
MTSQDVRAPDVLLSLRPGARLVVDADLTAHVAIGSAVLGLGTLGAAIAQALGRLVWPGVTEDSLADFVAEQDGAAAMLPCLLLLRRLDGAGLLARTVSVHSRAGQPGRVLATLEPCGLHPTPPGRVPRSSDCVGLSRFALLRRDGGRLVVESARSTFRVALHDARLAGLAALLTEPTALTDAAAAAGGLGLTAGEVKAILDLWGKAGLLTFPDAGTGPDEDKEQRLAQWHPVDLLFHQRSRLGGRALPYGGTYPLAASFDPLPAERPRSTLDVVFRPVDLARIAGRDPGLSEVIEARRSVRQHDDAHPITADQVGELLYRTVRIRRRFDDGQQEVLDRPVPSGGSVHPLDLYAAVRHCGGVPAGLYRYQPDGHGLVLVSDDVRGVRRLLAAVPLAPDGAALPQVLLVASARFGRVMWKYESMAYALLLKDLGVLYQSLYLIATAMGLAPCALGGGDSAMFARLAGLDPYEEGSVGEFAVGSMPTAPASVAQTPGNGRGK